MLNKAEINKKRAGIINKWRENIEYTDDAVHDLNELLVNILMELPDGQVIVYNPVSIPAINPLPHCQTSQPEFYNGKVYCEIWR